MSPKLTKKKFYGKYLHALIAHEPMLLRMVSGKSTNAEEERTFNSLKTITTTTPNFHPDHVILNAIIRYQAKGDFNAPSYLVHSETVVSKFSKSLPKTIPYWIINKFPRDWQAHLEKSVTSF